MQSSVQAVRDNLKTFLFIICFVDK